MDKLPEHFEFEFRPLRNWHSDMAIWRFDSDYGVMALALFFPMGSIKGDRPGVEDTLMENMASIYSRVAEDD